MGKGVPNYRPESYTLSPDGKRLLYAISKASSDVPGTVAWALVVDGEPQEDYERVTDPILSADSRHVAYTAKAKKGFLVVLDGVAGEAYVSVGGLTFSPDSTHFGCLIRRGDKVYLAVDDVAGDKGYVGILGGRVCFDGLGLLRAVALNDETLYELRVDLTKTWWTQR